MYKVDFSNLPSLYWDITTKMSYLQRRVIVHSIIYYELHTSIITDKEFDNLAYQLVELMGEASTKECEDTTYWYAMYDFDASTGFYIPSNLTEKDRNYLTVIAQHIIKRHEKNVKHERFNK